MLLQRALGVSFRRVIKKALSYLPLTQYDLAKKGAGV